ncbi:MAG: hypothetical protein WDW36_007810 [Sanguina aurantia]
MAQASRFWAAGSDSEEEKEEEQSDDESKSGSGSGSDSDSDSDSSSESGSDEEKGPSRFLAGSSDSDDGDDKRVIKSARDKRVSALASTCDEIHNKMKINDWPSIQSLFDELNKRLDKTQKVENSLGVPRVYIKLLVELEDFLNETLANKDVKKKMSMTNSKALNTMRQRLKKHNVGYFEQINKFRENPESTEEEEEDDDEEGSDGDEKTAANDAEAAEQRSAAAKRKERLLAMDPKEISYSMVSSKMRELAMTRGRRGTDKQEQVEMLTYLASVSKGPAQKFEILSQLVSSLFDLNPVMATHLKTSLWKRVIITLLDMLKLLQENPHVRVDEAVDATEERTEEPANNGEIRVWGNLVAFVERLDDELFKSLQVVDPHTHEYMQRLKDEPVFLALCQKVTEYLQRIGDNKNLPKVALRVAEHFYFKTGVVYDAMRKLTMRQQQAAVDAASSPEEDVVVGPDGLIDEKVEIKVPADYVMGENCHTVMEGLVAIIFHHGDERTKARAMLCSIYHKAIHDDFYTARDLMLMSHLQDSIQHMDVSTQILYNRALSQLGLAAFRTGLIGEAHTLLSELYSSGHIKELLAQGMSMNRYQEKTPEQELMEKRRQMPFHMHITLDLIESVYLVCAMLLEVPQMAASPLNPKKRMISKQFHRILDTYNRQMLTGPPENVRDAVMAATKALMSGDWAKAQGHVFGLSAWNLVPRKEQVLAMLKAKLQEEALRTYLFTYSAQYNSLSLDQLCVMFDLSEKKVYSVVSKMMYQSELNGSWDQPTRTIVMHSLEASKLQQLALQMADKAAIIVDLNERALAYRTGGLRDTDDDGAGGGRRRGQAWEEDGQGGRGGRGGRGGGGGRGYQGRGGDFGRGGGRNSGLLGSGQGYGGRGFSGGGGGRGDGYGGGFSSRPAGGGGSYGGSYGGGGGGGGSYGASSSSSRPGGAQSGGGSGRGFGKPSVLTTSNYSMLGSLGGVKRQQ